MREIFRAGLAVAALTSLLSACGSGVDPRRAEICRQAVPALAPAGAVPELLRVGAGPGKQTVRVEYRVAGRGEAAGKARWVLCGFGPGDELAGVATEGGPLGGAALYLLKRYYLGSPEARSAAPGLPSR